MGVKQKVKRRLQLQWRALPVAMTMAKRIKIAQVDLIISVDRTLPITDVSGYSVKIHILFSF